MASRVVMPKLTDTMEEGVLVKWKKQEGDTVGAGDILAEIETDKAVMDLEAFASGTLRKLLVREGETVKAGALIAVIAGPDEDIDAALKDTIAAAPSQRVSPPAQGPTPAARPQEKSTIKASPRAKTLASERGIDLAAVPGTGPEGRITEQDVLNAVAQKGAVPAGGVDIPLSQMRKAIARITTQSKAPVPHFYLTTDIAMEEIEKLRAKLKQSRHPHPSLTDLLIKASALALGRHPEINVSYGGETLRRHAAIDIGIAVGLDDGLITPVVRNCGAKTLEQIAEDSRALIERARNRRLQPEEYTDATFSISNLGMLGVDNFIAVLMPPQAAALAVGAMRDVPVVENGAVTVGRRMTVTLSCDHRALDGVQGAQFLKELKRILEHPQELLEPGKPL